MLRPTYAKASVGNGCIGSLTFFVQHSLDSAAPLPAEDAGFGGGSNVLGAVGTREAFN